ncbi:acyl-CoA synthetase [Pseudochelatococcus lubricantis]|uniref:Acyl-CoA synthetase n=1 Tax=Pseudochelatococcus lubricantis TaxID=1538102 RepID=A0ABX0UTT4_9HYPH|nr:class I adenylate-forming enzyme family protein [Pseudochelatococcus lubricantis]NIJ56372.1 acyl-CoA synthetase [Pseudochelatococcus lubricantis]
MQSTLLTLHDPATARTYYEARQWRDDTLYGLAAAHAASRPDRYALRDATRRLTWAELLRWADATAADLLATGLRAGDRVGVWLPNRVEATVAFLACSRAGFVCVPSLHQNHTVGEIVTLMERCAAAALVAQPGYGADADRHDIFIAALHLPAMRRVYTVEARPGLSGRVAAFPPADAPAALPPPVANPDKITYLAFTSGTTGAPKGVMHSDNTLLANGRAMVADWHLGPDTVIYSLSPLSHHIGTVALEQTLVAGCELVLNDAAKGVSPVDRIVETGATYVMGVPTHAIDILGEMERRGLASLGAVKTFYMAGAAIPMQVARRFLAYRITPQNIYGMTENGSHQYTMPDDDVETMVRTCGKACAAYEVRIWRPDAPDIEAEPGEVGEIGGRGACLMLGYFGNQAITERSFNAHGWFMSGDLGRLDPNGNLEIVGRSKDLIIRGGHNIHPSRIEDLAIRHPSVFKVAAFPVRDDRLGEKVCLAVIPCEGADVTAEEMLAHLFETGLSKYDMPEYFLVLDAFPLTASGKVLKREMVEQVRARQIEPTPVRFKPATKPVAATDPLTTKGS